MEINKSENISDFPSDYTMLRAEEQTALTAIFERIEDEEYEEQYIEDMIELYAEEEYEDYPF